MQTSTSTEAVGKLAEARSLIAAAWADVADADLPAGHAAYFALLVEQLGQEFARAQLFAADLLRRTGAHQLDADSFQAIADAGEHPSAEDLARAAGRTTMGRTPYKNTAGLLHNWLGIPLGTARDRLAQTDCLIAQVTTAGHRAAPLLPQLAAEFTAPRSDPRLVLSASRLIHGAQKDFGPGPAGQKARANIQAEAVALIREQPATARKHVADLIHQLKSGKRPLGALLSEIGLFKLGRRKGLEHYLLKVLPSQAEVVDAHLRKVDNPKPRPATAKNSTARPPRTWPLKTATPPRRTGTIPRPCRIGRRTPRKPTTRPLKSRTTKTWIQAALIKKASTSTKNPPRTRRQTLKPPSCWFPSRTCGPNCAT